MSSSAARSPASAAPSQGATVAGSTLASNNTASGLAVMSQTPIFSCVPASYNYTGGTPPYLLYIIQSGVINATVLKTLPAAAGPGTASWGCDINPGTSITFVVQDSKGQQEFSSPIVMELGNVGCLSSYDSTNHTGAIVGGVVGGVVGLLIVGLAVWFLIVRPARRSKSKGPDFYESAPASDHVKASTPPPPTRSIANQPVGTYNLQSVDFNESSLDALREQSAGPPAYGATGSARTAPNERPPIS